VCRAARDGATIFRSGRRSGTPARPTSAATSLPTQPRERPAAPSGRRPPPERRRPSKGRRPDSMSPAMDAIGTLQPPSPQPTPEEEGGGPSSNQWRSPAPHPAARLLTTKRGAPRADPRRPPHRRRGLGRQAPQGTARGGGEEEVAARARVLPPWSPWRGQPEERGGCLLALFCSVRQSIRSIRHCSIIHILGPIQTVYTFIPSMCRCIIGSGGRCRCSREPNLISATLLTSHCMRKVLLHWYTKTRKPGR
jgi:hypothetical protein